ncbi:hypothetical protein J4573_08480 [Actinomadura barringtoniae]|uniref:Uncharacterized protein n=1 Tax=Actinomadura barringtoniae TaxID=1427535 RepID=A0A939P7S3_9ACTN|nr:hypothetical protein [Actinomadura barringtoniae]MBO2447120.1 hypothetical protein [Actinomadura barringtoniae]
MTVAAHQRLRQRHDVGDGSYSIRAEDVSELPSPFEDGNGLISTAPDAATVITGLNTGDIWLTVETWDTEPPTELQDWDAVVEVPYTSTTGDAQIFEEWTDNDRPPFPNLATAGPGSYRLRAHARGRDTGRQADLIEPNEEPVEEHLLQIWPDTERPIAILKMTDQVGAETLS